MRRSTLRTGRLGTYGALAALAITLGSVAPAHAAISISIGGDSSFSITATATTSHTSVNKSTRVTGTAKLAYKTYVLGIPMYASGKYCNSFPTIFRQPRLDSWNGTLESTAYAKKYDSWLGTTQWLVRGESTFWGSKTVTIKGSAVGGTSGSRHFHAGSGTGNQIDANAAVRITVK